MYKYSRFMADRMCEDENVKKRKKKNYRERHKEKGREKRKKTLPLNLYRYHLLIVRVK